MPLLRLSRLYQDTAKNLCAGASPVARVPATPSGAYDLLFSGVSAFGRPARFVRPGRSCGMSRGAPSGRKPDPTFSVGKARGALSPPQQPIRAGQGAQLSSRTFSSPITGRRSRVTGRGPRSPQPPAFRLLNLPLLTVPFSLSPLQSALTQKCACKSFAIHSYKFIGLKVPWNHIVTKNTGGGGGAHRG